VQYALFKVALAYYSFQDFEHTPLSIDKFMKDPFYGSNPSIIATINKAISFLISYLILHVHD